MTPKRPYIIRAMHEWIEDNDYTAYLLVDAAHAELVAPLEYAIDERLVLAISYAATQNLHIDNDAISFEARFGGVSHKLWIPMQAVMAIYPKENSEQITFFDPSEYDGYQPTPKDNDKSTDNKPTLRILD